MLGTLARAAPAAGSAESLRDESSTISGTRPAAGLTGLADPVTRPGPDVGADAGVDFGAAGLTGLAEPVTRPGPDVGAEDGAAETGTEAEPEAGAEETGPDVGAAETGTEAEPEAGAEETGPDVGAAETGTEAEPEAGAEEIGTDAEPDAFGVDGFLNQSSCAGGVGTEPDTDARPLAPLTGAADGGDEAQSAPGAGGGGGAYPSWSSFAADPAAGGFVSSLLGVDCRSSIRPPDRRVPLARTPGAALNRAISALVSTPGINPIAPATRH